MPLLQIADPAKPEKSLTPAKIAKQIKPPKKGAKVVYWVRGIGVPPGFGLLVRPPTARWKINASWIMQADDPDGVSRRVNIARFGEVTFDDALTRARELREQIRNGENPNAEKRRQRAETMARERVLAPWARPWRSTRPTCAATAAKSGAGRDGRSRGSSRRSAAS